MHLHPLQTGAQGGRPSRPTLATALVGTVLTP